MISFSPNSPLLSLRYLILIFGLSLILQGCKKKDANILAKVGDQEIHADELTQAYDQRKKKKLTKSEVFEDLLNQKALLHKAYSINLDKNTDLKKELEKLLIQKYIETEIAPKLQALTISANEIKKYHSDNIDRFTKPGQRRIAIIQFKTKSENKSNDYQNLLAKINQIRADAITKSVDEKFIGFGELAKNHSKDLPSSSRNGDVGWIVDGFHNYRWGQKVNEAAFDLKNIGDISNIVVTDRGLYLVRLLDIRESKITPIEKIGSRTRNRLLELKVIKERKRLINKIRDSVEVEIYEE